MVDKDTDEEKPPAAPAAPRRGPGHRGADMRDTVAEMTERAQLISQEAGSKVSAAMKDVISAAAGLAGFAIESARDLVQYMVRRGQMTPEEAEKLIREAEDAHGKKPASERGRPTASKIAADKAIVDKAARDAANAAALLNAPPQRPGAFSLRTGSPKPAAPAPVAAAKPSAPQPKIAAPASKGAAPVKAPAKAAPAKAPAKAAPAKSAAGKKPAPSKSASKPAPKAPVKSGAKAAPGKSASKSASKPAAKPAPKHAKAPVKKKK